MALKSRKPNGSHGRGNGRYAIDTGVLRSRAEQMTVSVAVIARKVDEVAEGTATQVRGLGTTLADMNEIVASLGETADQAESARASSDGLVSSINEIAASMLFRQHDDRQVLILLMTSHKLEDVDAMHIRHVEIEDHELNPPNRQLLNASRPVPASRNSDDSSPCRDARTIFRMVGESSTIRILCIKKLHPLHQACRNHR